MTLKELRLKEGYTLKEVAKDLGIHYSSLSNYERGQTPLTPELNDKFCKYYKVNKIDESISRYCSLLKEINNLKEIIKDKEEMIENLKDKLNMKNKELKSYKYKFNRINKTIKKIDKEN